MTFKLINSPKAWELGPVEISYLKRLERSTRAMGNRAGANVLEAQIAKAERQWQQTLERHAVAHMTYTTDAPLTKIDTQGI